VAARTSAHPSGWTSQRRDSIARAYGRWLQHLIATDPDSLQLTPEARATDERLEGYLQSLERGCTASSQHTYLSRLLTALRVVAPGSSWSNMAQLIRTVTPAPHDATHRLADVRHPAQLLALAESLMDRAEALRRPDTPITSAAAVLFRDGVMLATLVLTVLRRRSLLSLALGDTLLETSGGFVILLQEEHTKARRAERVPVHPDLAAWLRRYLDHYRPVLAHEGSGPALWISQRGSPLANTSCWSAIATRTQAAFGVRIGPHFIRHCVATSTVIDSPERILDLPAVMQHRDFRVTERHYILASQLQAVDRYQQVLAQERAC
jgi:site-specific recombinase XerD